MKNVVSSLIRAYVTLSALYFVGVANSNVLKFLIAYGACYVCIKIVEDDDEEYWHRRDLHFTNSGDNTPPPRD